MSDWQPIDTAPKDGTYILLYVPNVCGEVLVARFYDCDGGGQWEGGEFEVYPEEVTHWMPLPPPPQEAKE